MFQAPASNSRLSRSVVRDVVGEIAPRRNVPDAPAAGVVVACAMPLSSASPEALTVQLGCTVIDIRQAPQHTDIVLSPVLSRGAVSVLRRMFPQARIVACEFVDDEHGADHAGPVSQALAAGVDEYRVARDPRSVLQAVLERQPSAIASRQAPAATSVGTSPMGWVARWSTPFIAH